MRAAYALAALALTGACSRGAHPTDVPTGLAQRVDASLGATDDAVGSATGPMGLDLAAAATAVPETFLRRWLKAHGFQGGYSRVWRHGDETTTALGYHFFADRDADAFVAYSADRLATSKLGTAFADPLVPGSRGFELVSTVQGKTRFCAGEYFAAYRDAFVVTRCTPYPVPPDTVRALAQRQLVRAVTGSTATP